MKSFHNLSHLLANRDFIPYDIGYQGVECKETMAVYYIDTQVK